MAVSSFHMRDAQDAAAASGQVDHEYVIHWQGESTVLVVEGLNVLVRHG